MIDARPAPDSNAAKASAPLVRVIEAKAESVQLTVESQGVVAARTESELAAEVSGRVAWVSPSLVPGGFFEEGQILFKIDPREYEFVVVRARAEVARARSRLAIEEQEAAVARREWESQGEGEPTALALRQPQVAEARAALAAAEAALAQTELDVERTIARAPYRGRVREKLVGVGEYLQRGAAAARVYSVDLAEVRLPIPDAELAYVRLPLDYSNEAHQREQGPPVVLTTEFAGLPQTWFGRIVRVEGEIDPQTHSVHAIAQVDDPYGRTSGSRRPPLSVGMFVRAEIVGRRTRALPLPRTAIYGNDAVWVVNDSDRLEFRKLEIFRREPDRVLATGGIEEGERVCTSRLEAAVAGMRVRVFEEQATEWSPPVSLGPSRD